MAYMVSTRKTYWLFLRLTSGLPPPFIVTPYITDILKVNSCWTKHSISPRRATPHYGVYWDGGKSLKMGGRPFKYRNNLSCSINMSSFLLFLGWVNQRHLQPLRSRRRNTGIFSLLSLRLPICLRAHLVVRKHFTLSSGFNPSGFRRSGRFPAGLRVQTFTAWASCASRFKNWYLLAYSGWITRQLQLIRTSVVYCSTLWVNSICSV